MTIEERLFLETDDSCAFCREPEKENLTIHHIDGNKDNSTYDNQIVLCHNCHQRHHQKDTITLEDINEKKKLLIIKTLTQYGVNALKIACRKEGRIVAAPFLLYHLVDMGFFKEKEDLMSYDDIDFLVNFEMTEQGRKLYQRWFLNK